MQISRKYIGIIIGLIIIFLAYNIINNNTNKITVNNPSIKAYSASGISFNYPANWSVERINETLIVSDSGGININNNIYTIDNDSNPNDAPQFVIEVLTNSGLTNQDLINSLQNLTIPSGGKIISNNTIVIDGSTAYEYTYTVNDPTNFDEIMTEQGVDFNKNGNTYIIDIQAPKNNFDNEKQNFNIILNSIKIQ